MSWYVELNTRSRFLNYNSIITISDYEDMYTNDTTSLHIDYILT